MTATSPPAGRVAGAHLALFASLYAVQGVVVAYITNFNTNYMTARGQTLDRAAVAETIALLPLALKFLIGPLSDRVSPLGLGHRRPYIVAGVLLQSIGLAGLATIDPGARLAAYGGMAMLTVIGLALYDTCCDGMAIDVTPAGDRERVQGLLWLSRFAATTVCTFAFGRWLGRPGVGSSGIPAVLWACAALGLVPLALARSARESPPAADAERFSWAALGSLGHPWTLCLLLYGGLYALAALGAEFKLSAFYKELGYGPGTIGDLGSIRYAGRAVGALLLPVAGRWVGQRGQLVLGLIALGASTAAQATITSPTTAGLMAFAFGLANGWSDALFAVLAMQGSDPRLAASTFALIMAVSNLSIVGNAVFAALATALGSFRMAYQIAALSMAPLLILAVPLGRTGPGGRAKPETIDADLA